MDTSASNSGPQLWPAGALEVKMSTGKPGKWLTLQSSEIFRASFVRLRTDRCQLPDGKIMPAYHVMEFPDWVNIVPVTEDGRIVMVEQYRHALGEVCLEIPGGTTDPRHPEDPKKAALRELREETGYVPDDLRLIAKHSPNPALQNNWMHTYIAYGCRKVGEPEPDPYEDLRTVIMTVPEVVQGILDGKIHHSIIIASIMHALPVLGFHLPK